MRKLAVLSIIAILAACVFIGCGGDDDDDDNDNIVGPGGNGTGGYAAMTAGSWAKHNMTSPPGATDTYKWLGEDNWEGKQCYVMEFEMFMPGEGTTINQVWIDKVTGESVLYLIKMDGKVMRMDLGQTPTVPSDESYDGPDIQKVGEDKYTTPTNKTVNVVIYRQNSPGGTNEFWTSNEVPFGSVKDLLNGQVQSALYDFSFSGASRGITKDEAINAESMTFPDIPGGGGDIPDGGGDIPDGGGDIPDDGGVGIVVITVGAGARPTISVSKPIQYLVVIAGFVPAWSFDSPDLGQPGGLSFAGPFQYGVLPNGANSDLPNPPDMVAGQSYIIQVSGISNVGMPVSGVYTFTR